MEVTLIGVGLGNPETMTGQARAALEGADCVIGSRRLVEELAGESQKRYIATKPADILAHIRESGAQRPCVLYSGDTGFYSGARTLLPMLEEAGLAVQVLPGISSVQYFAAKLGQPWQGWNLVSAHGVDCDPVAAVLGGRDTFFLTSGGAGAGQLCRRLTKAGLGQLAAIVGEELSYPGERFLRGTAAQFGGQTFAALSVLLVQGVTPKRRAVSQGIPDEEFIRDQVPMTKQEVRAAALAKLEICEGDTLYDIGAGTGSVSVEMALLAKTGSVYAIEEKGAALALIRANREKFGVLNLNITAGSAPEVLAELPAPDGVFIGGSRGRLEDILDCVLRKNPKVRICVSAIAVETLGAATAALTSRGLQVEMSQLSVARSRQAGNRHLMMAQNPVWLICARRGVEE